MRNPYVDNTDSREVWLKMSRTTYSTSSSLVFNDDACLTFKGHVRLPIGGDEEVEEWSLKTLR
jgi:hypothetical protein